MIRERLVGSDGNPNVGSECDEASIRGSVIVMSNGKEILMEKEPLALAEMMKVPDTNSF